MGILSYALNGNLKNFNNKLKEIAKKENRSLLSLYKSFFHCFNLIGSGYSDFLNYKLYKRTDEEIKEYVTIKTQDYFYEIVSPAKYKTAFTIKANFLKNFKEFCNRDTFYNGSKEDFLKFLGRHEKIVYKPVNSLGGDRVRSLYVKDIKNKDDFYNEVITNNIQLEEYVIQHEEMAKFAPNSVNTIRVMSFCYNDKPEIFCVMMRMGNGKADVDNFHQGGMGVLVDIETGKLVGNAVDKDDNVFEVHPYSGVKFDGFQIPHWDKVKEMVMKAAKVNKNIHVVGWDVCVTPDGCTFIEGNRRPGFDLPQVLYDRGRKDFMRHCLDVINKSEGTNYKV